MNIRKKLIVSNLMMIIIPVIASAVAGLCAIGIIWHVMHHGSGVGVDDAEDFSLLSRIAASYVSDVLKKEISPHTSALSELIDANTMYLLISRNGREIYSYGTREMRDSILMDAASSIPGNDIIISEGGRNMYRTIITLEDGNYEVILFATTNEMETKAFRMAARTAWIILILTIVISVSLTNHFISKSLFRRIVTPLDKLAKGASELGEGNLDYRITYSRDDEFRPICLLFNKMAEKLKELVERTRSDDESRKELIAGISHDLRSPLTSIQAYVEGLEDGVASTPEMRKRYLSVINSKVRDIDSLVSDLFLFSKLDLNDYPVELETASIGNAIEAFISQHNAEYEQRGLSINFPLVDSGIEAVFDRTLLARVMQNIADNSAKYKSNEHGNLYIDVKEGKDHVTIAFSDDGRGVDDDEYERLFDVFYRSDGARKRPSDGSGLGLAISRKMVSRMNGRIRAEKSVYGGLAIVMDLEKGEKDEKHPDNRR